MQFTAQAVGMIYKKDDQPPKGDDRKRLCIRASLLRCRKIRNPDRL